MKVNLPQELANENMNGPTGIVIGLVLGIAIVSIAALIFLRKRSQVLRERFGPEYTRQVSESGDRWKAESALEHRKKRVESLHIRVLTAAERAQFQEAWRSIQAQFVDDPNATLVEADRLIGKVLSAEGYPVTDFEQRAADISVDHPVVVENYRRGHRIALRHAQGQASTEELRQAMVCYRTLFDDLLGQPEYTQTGRVSR